MQECILYCLLYFTCLCRIICTYMGKQSKQGERDRRSIIVCSCKSGGPGEAALPSPKHFHLHSSAILSIKHFHLDRRMFWTFNKASTGCYILTNRSKFGSAPSKVASLGSKTVLWACWQKEKKDIIYVSRMHKGIRRRFDYSTCERIKLNQHLIFTSFCRSLPGDIHTSEVFFLQAHVQIHTVVFRSFYVSSHDVYPHKPKRPKFAVCISLFWCNLRECTWIKRVRGNSNTVVHVLPCSHERSSATQLREQLGLKRWGLKMKALVVRTVIIMILVGTALLVCD